ncbi:MAG: hypothetical protein C0592_03660 [Marinilabiliales bacterium]|nr:MAG: hypothetical protein C0592_03660 [Marinilabiliales bacterium]
MPENSERFLIQSALPKAEKFCAYQERCIFEVKQKLTRLGLSPNIQTKVINILLEKDFINEERYTELFIRSKINQNGWGPYKISQELNKRQIPKGLINKYLNEFPDDQHDEILKKLIESKLRNINEEDKFKKKQKVLRFAYSKGYSVDQTERVLKNFEL